MAITNHERVGKAMDLLEGGLAPFVEREVQERVQGQAAVDRHGRYVRRRPSCWRRSRSPSGTRRRCSS